MSRTRLRMLSDWIAEQSFGPLYRVALDAGSTCPNRDGTKGFGGCVYCDVEGSGTGALRQGEELARQLQLGLERIRRRAPGARAIAYFQSYSNTYVTPERLEEVLAVLEPYVGREVAVLALATRPDTLPDWALEVLAHWQRRLPVWLELGLECANDELLTRIGRLHTVAEFEAAVLRAHAAGLATVGHAILGLPGDGRAGARRTAEVLARSRVWGVKVHHLMVLRRTILESWWRAGEVETLDADEYVAWLADFVERLAPDQVLHRLTGDAGPSELVAPTWPIAKNEVRARLERELERRGARQGSSASHARASDPSG
jgi:radical SAM protein (TIGR01212 family)